MGRSFAQVLEAAEQGLAMLGTPLRLPFADLMSVRAFEDHAAMAAIEERFMEKADAP
jgi:hypothetical protein